MIPYDPIRLVIVLWVVTGVTKVLLILLVIRGRYWTHRPHAWRLGRITHLSSVMVVFWS